MTVPWDRAGHGNGAGQRRIEVPPAPEAARGVAAPERDREAMPRPPYAAGSLEARVAGSRGGKAAAGRNDLADNMGGKQSASRRRADAFRKAELRHLRLNVGGGKLSPGVRALVKLAALQMAAAEKAFDESRDADGNKLAEGARQNLLAAHAKAAREAETPRTEPRQRRAKGTVASVQTAPSPKHAAALAAFTRKPTGDTNGS